MDKYTIKVFWSDNDNAWIGVCPEFEDIAVVGHTRKEAFAEADAAVVSFIEIYQEDNMALPQVAAPDKTELLGQLNWLTDLRTTIESGDIESALDAIRAAEKLIKQQAA